MTQTEFARRADSAGDIDQGARTTVSKTWLGFSPGPNRKNDMTDHDRIATIALTLAAIAGLGACGISTASAPTTTVATPDTSVVSTPAADLSWVSALGPTITSMSSDLTLLSTDMTAGNVTATTSDCASGSADVAGWRAGAAAVPDASVQTLLFSAIALYSEAFAMCSSGDFTTMTTAINAANAQAQAATAAIKAA